MNCHANAYILMNMHYELYAHDCWCCGRSGKFQVRLCVVIKKLSYEKYDEMHRELINLHPGVSAPAQS